MDPENERWGWIDLERQIVFVRATLARVGVEDEAGWQLAPPKTENSKRDVPICDDTIAELRRWKKQQLIERMKLGAAWQKDGFVFTSEIGSPLGYNVRRAWASVMKAADQGRGDLGTVVAARERKVVTRKTTTGRQSVACSLGPPPEESFTPRFSVYVLRHTMATLNYLDGMDLGLLSRRLGHAHTRDISISLTDRISECLMALRPSMGHPPISEPPSRERSFPLHQSPGPTGIADLRRASNHLCRE